jgi:alanine dehydrogenase
MNTSETIILSRKQVAELLSVNECIDAIEGVFHLYGNGQAQKPGILGVHTEAGGFHIKAGVLKLGRSYFVAKTNANFPNNPQRHSLPTIQGVVAVFDGDNGKLLALLDSIEISILRTGAATAVAAKYLAKKDSTRLTICGTGNQGRISLRSLEKLFVFEKVFACDINEQSARAFATEMSQELNLDVAYSASLAEAAIQSEIIVTCTPSRQPYLSKSDISPGTFIAAVGSDNEDKQELDSKLVASAKLVTDVTEQCASIGELHHAIRTGEMTPEHVSAELGEVIAGKKSGRERSDETIIFDSTGMALQDVAAAAIVYEKALIRKIGLSVNLNH